ncbi:MAG: hypothetical protein RLY57_328 [Candidatus Parcubacteria bacterium]|jgi:hypothetical protein
MKKKKRTKATPESSKSLWWIGAGFVVILTCLVILMNQVPEQTTIIPRIPGAPHLTAKEAHDEFDSDVPRDEIVAQRKYVEDHAVTTQLRQGYAPVQIFMANNPNVSDDVPRTAENLTGTGMVILNQGEPTELITAQHIFSKPGYYSIKILGPFNGNRIWRIESVSPINDSRMNLPADLAMAKIGIERLIGNIWPHPGRASNGVNHLNERIEIQHSITGQKFLVIGETGNTYRGNTRYSDCFVIDYPSVSGESGTVFYGKEKEFYILSGSTYFNEVNLGKLGLSGKGRRLTMVTRVNMLR